ncbi:MAG: carbon-phosphorus lyase complex subunit PhnI [Coriobacteriia bacterium]|nr:carbon-phosphorus lyase complex subunit PhnI [Coriobacteriia bacterium]
MAYVAVSGGEEAIEESIRLLEYYQNSAEGEIAVEAITNQLSLLVDRVMGEAGLYSRSYAALALRQCEGSVEEAVFLLRAYRSTLTRNYYTHAVDATNMRVIRRISAAFKDIKGGQLLGPSYDYTHRLIKFNGATQSPQDIRQTLFETLEAEQPEEIASCPRVSDELRSEGLIEQAAPDDQSPHDVTMHMLEFPTTRSARLQTLARADTGFVSGLAYSALRGFGQVHPTVGELRSGYVELYVSYLLDEQESVYLGEVLITEVEGFSPAHNKEQLKISVGYGAVFGRCETKAIAMAVIDNELNQDGPYPTQDEEFVLMHGDSLEMNGFISHLKLPHYVTFQSKLDAVRKTRLEGNKSHE